MPEKSVKAPPENGSPVTPSKKEKKSSSKKEHKEHHRGEEKEGKGGKKLSKKPKDDSKVKKTLQGDDVKREPAADPFAPLSLDAWLDGDDTKDADR